MPITQKVIAINDFGLQRRERTSATGKTSNRFTVTVSAQPIVHVVDAKELGRGPAEAIAEHLRIRIKSLPNVASPATLAARKRNADAFAKGFPGTTARYSGGRMGPMPPNQSVRLFNDSGRLAAGLVARHGNRDEWVINVPANRFDPRTLTGGEEALLEIFFRLKELIPEFSDPAKLMQVGSIQAAIKASYESILQKNDRLTAKLASTRRRVLKQALGLLSF